MKKDITVVIIGAIVGAITTALLGMGQIVYPLKESLQMTLSEKNILEKKLSQYMFGETIKIVQTAELSFEVANISHAKHDLLIIKVLVSNLTDKTIYHFGILSRGTSVQTETLDVYGVKRLSVLTTGMLEQNRVGMPIPPNAKHIPISIEVSNLISIR